MILFYILFPFALSKNETTIAIFNNFLAKNVPVLFRWTGDDEVVTNVKNYENPLQSFADVLKSYEDQST